MNEPRPIAPFGSAYIAFADEEISRLSDDKLSRAHFARRVADLIESIPVGADSTVIGLMGPWGGGKTSLLNLICADLAEADSMGVAHFTPWAVSDSSALMVEFFATLLGAHESLKSIKQKQKWKSLAQKIAPIVGGLGGLGKAAENAAASFLEEGNWRKQFNELDEAISASGVRILITVDDVDRLHGDEILTLIKTIRMLGRFHNVHYLLAYDHSALVDALKPSVGGCERRASEYLEKIVQYPLDIPPAQEVHLKAILDEGLGHLFGADPSIFLSDTESRFQMAYERELKHRLTTVRSVKRFVAQANHYFALVSGHVDVADFLVLTFLRLHYPTVYSQLPAWRGDLVVEKSGVPREVKESAEVLWTARLSDAGLTTVGDRAIVSGLLKRVFPYAFSLFANDGSPGRAASRSYFDRYFVFGLPEGDISDTRVRDDFLRTACLGMNAVHLYAGTFTAPSVSVRHLAVEKAEKLVAEAKEPDIPRLTQFVVWLMSREEEADPRYMYAVLLGDLVARHPGFSKSSEYDDLFSPLQGVRLMRSALDRASTVRDYLGVGQDTTEALMGPLLSDALTRLGVAELVAFADSQSPEMRSFMDTYAVVREYGDENLRRMLIADALANRSLTLDRFAAFLVFSEMQTTASEYTLRDLDIDGLLTIVAEDDVYGAEIPRCPSDEEVEDRTIVSWERRRLLAVHGLWAWRRARDAAKSGSTTELTCGME